jgi:hypothetical protein
VIQTCIVIGTQALTLVGLYFAIGCSKPSSTDTGERTHGHQRVQERQRLNTPVI